MDQRLGNAARYIQRAWRSTRFLNAWRLYRKRVVYIQSIWRGKQARKDYKKIREEARDLKQISYKLENKVVELTQTVGKLKVENKSLLEKVESFDAQVKTWRQKHANLENRTKELQLEANQAGIATARIGQMDEEMKALQKQFDESRENMKRLLEEGKVLRENLAEKTIKLDEAVARDKAHEEEKMTLRQQIQALEDALENAGSRAAEVKEAPTTTAGGIANGLINLVSNKKPKRRSAEAPVKTSEPLHRMSYTTRPVSMMPTSQPHRDRTLDILQYSPPLENSEFELLRILEDDHTLNEEAANALVKNLVIPHPDAVGTELEEKEVLFPAYMINLVTSEMWNNGFVKESEKFLANVMQNIQQAVMVSFHDTCTPIFLLTKIVQVERRGHHCWCLLALERPRDVIVRLPCRGLVREPKERGLRIR